MTNQELKAKISVAVTISKHLGNVIKNTEEKKTINGQTYENVKEMVYNLSDLITEINSHARKLPDSF